MNRVFRLVACVCLLAVVACPVFAQLGGTAQSPAVTNQSSFYGQWVIHSLNSTAAGAATMVVDNCYVKAGLANKLFFPLATNAAITVIDGANTETVTPSSVVSPTAAGPGASTVNPFSCSVTATFSNAHGGGVSIISGDNGVAEAANDNGYAYGVFKGVDIIPGTCTGTATASATLALFGPDKTTTTACTSTSPLAGRVIDRSVTVKNLSCTASAGGVSGAAGVVSVLKNHQGTEAAQALTCTFGTATSCSDTTHTFNAVAGDILGAQFTTQGSETLANVACTFQAF